MSKLWSEFNAYKYIGIKIMQFYPLGSKNIAVLI